MKRQGHLPPADKMEMNDNFDDIPVDPNESPSIHDMGQHNDLIPLFDYDQNLNHLLPDLDSENTINFDNCMPHYSEFLQISGTNPSGDRDGWFSEPQAYLNPVSPSPSYTANLVQQYSPASTVYQSMDSPLQSPLSLKQEPLDQKQDFYAQLPVMTNPSPPDKEQMKRERRKASNRKAAEKYRQKQKATVDYILQDYKKKSKENDHLKREVEQLRNRVQSLDDYISSHKKLCSLPF